MKSLFKKYTHYLVICSLLLTFACGGGNNKTQSDNVLNDTVPQGTTPDKTEAERAAEKAADKLITDSLYNTYYTAVMQNDYDKVMQMMHPVAFKITPKSEFLEDLKGMQTFWCQHCIKRDIMHVNVINYFRLIKKCNANFTACGFARF